MGIGDEMIAMGQARSYVREHGCDKVAIVDRNGTRRSHFIWARCSYIAGPSETCTHKVISGGNARPYVDYVRTTPLRWAWRLDFRPTPAELPWIKADEQARDLILIEPEIKSSASPNKQWGQWQTLVDAAPSLPWAQLGRGDSKFLRGVRQLVAPTFVEACGMLRAARCAVLPEGALHHAAAAMNCPAVVLFGAYIPASVTGYDQHFNIAVDDPAATGWRIVNERCQAAWKTITPQQILTGIKKWI